MLSGGSQSIVPRGDVYFEAIIQFTFPPPAGGKQGGKQNPYLYQKNPAIAE
jgi:hypothetical protein